MVPVLKYQTGIFAGSLEYPLKTYDFDLKNMSEDIILFQPMMAEAQRKSYQISDRKYPVEMPTRVMKCIHFPWRFRRICCGRIAPIGTCVLNEKRQF